MTFLNHRRTNSPFCHCHNLSHQIRTFAHCACYPPTTTTTPPTAENGLSPCSSRFGQGSRKRKESETKEQRADDRPLSQTNRKQEVQTKATELELLEQRIRDMEARLKSNGKAPALQTTIPERRPVAPQASNSTLTAATEQKHGGSRPGTAKASQQAVPGALPPTPTASEGEYEFVPDPFTTSFGPEYPRYRHHLLLPRMTSATNSGGGSATGTVLYQTQQLRSQHYQQHPHQSILGNNSNQRMSTTILNKPPSQPDARSVKSVRTIGSENGSADFVIVPGPDGDGEQDHH